MQSLAVPWDVGLCGSIMPEDGKGQQQPACPTPSCSVQLREVTSLPVHAVRGANPKLHSHSAAASQDTVLSASLGAASLQDSQWVCPSSTGLPEGLPRRGSPLLTPQFLHHEHNINREMSKVKSDSHRVENILSPQSTDSQSPTLWPAPGPGQPFQRS